jgi:NADH-quinone oxidoreductase subunit E
MGNDAPEGIDLGKVRRITEEFLAPQNGAGPVGAEMLIPLLQRLQEAYGYLPQAALAWISRETGIPASRMYGVGTFYAQFSLEPRGRHTVRCCRGTACHVRGGKKVIAAAQSALGLADGETAADMSFSFETVACLGACALAPVAVVDTTYYGKMTPRRAEQIIEQLKEGPGDDET